MKMVKSLLLATSTETGGIDGGTNNLHLTPGGGTGGIEGCEGIGTEDSG